MLVPPLWLNTSPDAVSSFMLLGMKRVEGREVGRDRGRVLIKRDILGGLYRGISGPHSGLHWLWLVLSAVTEL